MSVKSVNTAGKAFFAHNNNGQHHGNISYQSCSMCTGIISPKVKKDWPAGAKGVAETEEAKQQVIRGTLANWGRRTTYMGGLTCLGGLVSDSIL